MENSINFAFIAPLPAGSGFALSGAPVPAAPAGVFAGLLAGETQAPGSTPGVQPAPLTAEAAVAGRAEALASTPPAVLDVAAALAQMLAALQGAKPAALPPPDSSRLQDLTDPAAALLAETVRSDEAGRPPGAPNAVFSSQAPLIGKAFALLDAAAGTAEAPGEADAAPTLPDAQEFVIAAQELLELLQSAGAGAGPLKLQISVEPAPASIPGGLPAAALTLDSGLPGGNPATAAGKPDGATVLVAALQTAPGEFLLLASAADSSASPLAARLSIRMQSEGTRLPPAPAAVLPGSLAAAGPQTGAAAATLVVPQGLPAPALLVNLPLPDQAIDTQPAPVLTAPPTVSARQPAPSAASLDRSGPGSAAGTARSAAAQLPAVPTLRPPAQPAPAGQQPLAAADSSDSAAQPGLQAQLWALRSAMSNPPARPAASSMARAAPGPGLSSAETGAGAPSNAQEAEAELPGAPVSAAGEAAQSGSPWDELARSERRSLPRLGAAAAWSGAAQSGQNALQSLTQPEPGSLGALAAPAPPANAAMQQSAQFVALDALPRRLTHFAQQAQAAPSRSFEAQLDLAPPSIGRLQVSLLVQGNSVAVQVAASSETQLKQLREALAPLRQSLAEAGLELRALKLERVEPGSREDSGGGARQGRSGQDGQEQRRAAENNQVRLRAENPAAADYSAAEPWLAFTR